MSAPRPLALALLVALALAPACKTWHRAWHRLSGIADVAADAGAEPPGDQPGTTVGPFDAAAMHAALQGHWRVVDRGGKPLFDFYIRGDHARVVDHRDGAARTIEGVLVPRSATGFGIRKPDDVTYYWSFVRANGQTFMGLGAAYEIRGGARFTATLGAWERLHYDRKRCTYSKTWGGRTVTRSVKCSFSKRGRQQIFSYQAEDSFHAGALKTYELIRVGHFLLDKQLADSIAIRIPAPAARHDARSVPALGHDARSVPAARHDVRSVPASRHDARSAPASRHDARSVPAPGHDAKP